MTRPTNSGQSSGPAFGWFDEPRASTRTTVALVADTHLAPGARGSWKLYHRTERQLRRVINDLDPAGVDAVVFAGDLTQYEAEAPPSTSEARGRAP